MKTYHIVKSVGKDHSPYEQWPFQTDGLPESLSLHGCIFYEDVFENGKMLLPERVVFPERMFFETGFSLYTPHGGWYRHFPSVFMMCFSFQEFDTGSSTSLPASSR